MARIRTIKPDFYTDGTLGECSMSARYAFIGTWVFADDCGNFERSSRQFKAQVFPYDDIDCEAVLCELIEHGLLIEYEVDSKKYLHIKGFDKHQKIDRTSKPRFPLYDDSLRTRRVFDEDSIWKGKEGKGKEGNGSLRSPSPSLRSGSNQSSLPVPDLEAKDKTKKPHTDDVSKGKAKADRLVPWPFGDGPAPDVLTEFARKRLPNADIGRMWEQFANHSKANGKRFIDWSAAWRTWVLNAPKFDKGIVVGTTPADIEAKIAASRAQLSSAVLSAVGSPLNDRVETKVCVAASQGNLLQEHENGLAEDSGSTAVLEGEILPAKTDNSEEVVFPWDDEEGF